MGKEFFSSAWDPLAGPTSALYSPQKERERTEMIDKKTGKEEIAVW